MEEELTEVEKRTREDYEKMLVEKEKEIEELKEKANPEVIEERVQKKMIEWDKKILDRINQIESEIKGEINFGELRNESEQLEIFKQQFISTIEKNVEKFNKKLEEMNNTAKTMEEQFNNRTKLIDSKMRELDEFTKKFAKEMGIVIDKMTENK